MNETRCVARKAYAKVNLFLNVAGRRPDGYHDLEMFNATIDLCDDVTIEALRAGTPGIQIHSNDKYFENGDNLITRIAERLLEEHGCETGVRITIEKRIPAGAGLGGNSADAAAVLRGLDELFCWRTKNADLEHIALRHGADIPYCLGGGPAFVGGIGDVIVPADIDLSAYAVLVVHPNVYVGTETVFAAWDAGNHPQVPIGPVRDAVAAQNAPALLAAMRNALEPVTFSLAPAVCELKDKMLRELGPEGVVMTGSGSTILKVFRDKTPEIDRFIEENRRKYRIFTGKFTNKE